MVDRIFLITLFLCLFINQLMSQETLRPKPIVKQRGYSFESFQKPLKQNKSEIKEKLDTPKIDAFKSSVEFINRKPENSYFPLEKDKPSLVFRMTWGF